MSCCFASEVALVVLAYVLDIVEDPSLDIFSLFLAAHRCIPDALTFWFGKHSLNKIKF